MGTYQKVLLLILSLFVIGCNKKEDYKTTVCSGNRNSSEYNLTEYVTIKYNKKEEIIEIIDKETYSYETISKAIEEFDKWSKVYKDKENVVLKRNDKDIIYYFNQTSTQKKYYDALDYYENTSNLKCEEK